MTCKVQILSDLHLSKSSFEIVQTDAQVLVLAGDVADSGDFTLLSELVKPVIARGVTVLWVLGNHEHYTGSMEVTLRRFRRLAREIGVILLHNRQVVVHGVRFVGTTLWTDLALHGINSIPLAKASAAALVGDYTRIQKHNRPLLGEDTIKHHQRALRYLRRRLAECFEGNTVVVTHHSPHPNSIAEEYKDNLFATYFASDLTDMLVTNDIAAWIHGHTHDVHDYYVGATRVLCNARGHVKPGGAPTKGFDPAFVVEFG